MSHRAHGTALPGFEHLRDEHDVIEALVALKRGQPTLGKAMIKLNEGFSGEGNAVFAYDGAPSDSALARWVRTELPARVRCGADGETWEDFVRQMAGMGGIVESHLEGRDVRSPSVQCRIDPLGNRSVIATHDQVLGGPTGQVYLGCTFPADAAYCRDIQEDGLRVARVLAGEGVLARFGVDFVSMQRHDGQWESTAIEINLRKGERRTPTSCCRC